MKDVIEVSLTPKDKELIAKIIAEQPDVDTPDQALLWALRAPVDKVAKFLLSYLKDLDIDVNLDGTPSVVPLETVEKAAAAAMASGQNQNTLIYDLPPIEPSTHTELDRSKAASETTEDTPRD